MATNQTLIDVKKGKLTMQVNNQKVIFNVFNVMKYPDENYEQCHAMNDYFEELLTEEEEYMEIEKNEEEKEEPLNLSDRVSPEQMPSQVISCLY